MEVVEAAALGRLKELAEVGVRPVADPVPVDARCGDVAVGQELRGRLRTVLVIPAERTHELLPEAVAPQAQVVWLTGVEPELAELAGPDPFRPHEANEAVREEAEPDRRVARPDVDSSALAPEAVLAQRHPVRAGLEFGVDTSAGGGARDLDRLTALLELHGDVLERNVTLVADPPGEHAQSSVLYYP